MRLARHALSGILIGLITLTLLEGSSALVISLLSRAPGSEYLQFHLDRFHPLFRKNEDGDGLRPLYQRRDESNPFIFDPRQGYANRPGKSYDSGLMTSPEGFICNDACLPLDRVKSVDEVRIFLFGGSSVAGQGAGKGAYTISGRMETMIAETNVFPGKKVRVINAGVGGYYSAQELSLFVNSVLFYSPDYVIFLDGNNDYIEWSYVQVYPFAKRYSALWRPNVDRYDYTLIEGIERVQTPGGAVLHTLNLLNDTYPVLYYSGLLAKTIRLRQSTWGVEGLRQAGAPPLSSTAAPSAGVAVDELRWLMAEKTTTLESNSALTYLRNLDSAAAIARANGIGAVFCLQPVMGDPDDKGLPRKTVLSAGEKTFADTLATERPYMDVYYARARQMFEERSDRNDSKVRFVDLAETFRHESAQMWLDDVHYTPDGNLALAKALLAQLKPLVPAGQP